MTTPLFIQNSHIRIALVGSRKLEQHVIYSDQVDLCFKVCYRLARLGITFTSGLCELGMDGIAQKAYSLAVNEDLATLEQFEVYVKDQKSINQSRLPNKHIAKVRNPDLLDRTLELASAVHPAWDRCNDYAKAQHSRNCHQIFGYTLDKPVDAVITWCPLDAQGKPTGGTATAIRLAWNAGIPVFNLWESDKDAVRYAIRDFLQQKGVQGLKY